MVYCESSPPISFVHIERKKIYSKQKIVLTCSVNLLNDSGRTNTWWYNLRDSNPDNEAKFALVKADALETKELAFNLSCPVESGAPAPVNLVKDEGAKGKDNAAAAGNAVLGMAMVGAFMMTAVGLSGWL